MKSQGLDRRSFLRGLGACVALPAFESFAPARLVAKEKAGVASGLGVTSTGAPLRAVFVYFPNGAIPSVWWPKGGQTDFEFNRTMQPLASVREHLQILGGLDHR